MYNNIFKKKHEHYIQNNLKYINQILKETKEETKKRVFRKKFKTLI